MIKKKKRIVKVFETDSDKKCSGCHWCSDVLYGIGSSLEVARLVYTLALDEDEQGEYGIGLCSNCILKVIIESFNLKSTEIKKKTQKKI